MTCTYPKSQKNTHAEYRRHRHDTNTAPAHKHTRTSAFGHIACSTERCSRASDWDPLWFIFTCLFVIELLSSLNLTFNLSLQNLDNNAILFCTHCHLWSQCSPQMIFDRRSWALFFFSEMTSQMALLPSMLRNREQSVIVIVYWFKQRFIIWKCSGCSYIPEREETIWRRSKQSSTFLTLDRSEKPAFPQLSPALLSVCMGLWSWPTNLPASDLVFETWQARLVWSWAPETHCPFVLKTIVAVKFELLHPLCERIFRPRPCSAYSLRGT